MNVLPMLLLGYLRKVSLNVSDSSFVPSEQRPNLRRRDCFGGEAVDVEPVEGSSSICWFFGLLGGILTLILLLTPRCYVYSKSYILHPSSLLYFVFSHHLPFLTFVFFSFNMHNT